MKKFSMCLLLILIISVPLFFVGCQKDNLNASNNNTRNESKSIIEEKEPRSFVFKALNDYENIEYDFDNNLIKVRLVSDDSFNVVNFSAKIYNDGKLESKQAILYNITDEANIEIVNCKFTNVYLKFNKVGSFTLTIYDETEYLIKNINIVVE